jgi:hypothetical protein
LGPVDLEGLAFEAAGPEWAGYNPLVDWVIVGGESGHNARPMHPKWARSLRDQCQGAGVAFFFKQWGEFVPDDHYKGSIAGKKPHFWPGHIRFTSLKVGKHEAGRLLDGVEWSEFPKVEVNQC